MNAEPETPHELTTEQRDDANGGRDLEPSQLDQAVGGATSGVLGGTGALYSASGVNTWSGNITLPSSAAISV